MAEDSGNAFLYSVGCAVDGGASMSGQQFAVNQFADIQVLHPGAAEIPSMFVVQEFGDAFLIETVFHIGQCNGFTGLVFDLVLNPRAIGQTIHLVKEVARGGVELFRAPDFHETAPEEDSVLVHDPGIRKIGIPGKETGDFFPSGEDGRLRFYSTVLGEHFMNGAEWITKSRGGGTMMQSVPKDVVGQNQLVVESIDLEDIGSLLSKSSASAVFSVDILGISHAGPACEDDGAVGERVDMNMV